MITELDLLTIINQPPVTYLATIEGASPQIRALENLRHSGRYPVQSPICQQAGFVFYLSTSGSSGKVKSIEKNPEVSLYFCDFQNFKSAMFQGKAEVFPNEELRRALWDDRWKIYWPGGIEDPDYVLLRITPRKVSGWWQTQPYEMELSGL